MTVTIRDVQDLTRGNHESARALWMAERKKLLTSTDAARILGCSPYGGPIDVFLEKTGKTVDKPDDPTSAQRAGRYLERPILIMYADLTGIPIVFGDPHKSIVSQTQPLVAAQIDARRQDEPSMPSIDAKNIRFQTKDWGQEGTDQIPLHVAVQLVIQMHVLATPFADIAALFSGQDIVPYRLHRDLETEQGVIGTMLDFHQKYIVKDVPPPVDGSESYGRYLASKFKKMVEGLVVDAAPEHNGWATKLLQVKAQMKLLKMDEDVLKNLFRQAIGERHSIQGADWKATWSKPSKPGTKVDWQAVSKDLAGMLGMLAELLKSPDRLAVYVAPGADGGPAPCTALAQDVAERYARATKEHSTESFGVRKFTLTSKKGGTEDE